MERTTITWYQVYEIKTKEIVWGTNVKKNAETYIRRKRKWFEKKCIFPENIPEFIIIETVHTL